MGGVNSHFLQKPLDIYWFIWFAGQGPNFIMFWGCQRLCPARMRSVTSDLAAVISMIFFSPGSSKLPCKTIAFAL